MKSIGVNIKTEKFRPHQKWNSNEEIGLKLRTPRDQIESVEKIINVNTYQKKGLFQTNET